ncbi:tyrosine-type recombinase/integrase [Azospirillum halopraeferens]|uniref:tyrosine-type recombinase/integrase n=1 Tax=Azospirillum halopraeferens TaxID=34010 RepID=UPI0004242244|nr:tyrosine-type recombinase/integrase [Azospirillum halopraeferens]
MNVQQACADFLNHCRVKNLSPHSLRAYAIDLREFTRFIGPETAAAAVDRPALRRYLTHLFEARRLKETSVKRRLASLKVMFRWLELDEVIAVSPFHRLDARIRLPRRLPRSLTGEEMAALLRAAAAGAGIAGRPTEAKVRKAAARAGADSLTALVAVELLLCTGLRVGELAAVRLGDLDRGAGVLTVNGKGSRQRRVFLPDPVTVALVESYLAARAARAPGHDRLLITASGGPADAAHIRLLVRRTGEAAGLERRITPHMLRHTAATQLLENGVDIRFVQRLLGHQSISTTEGYTTVTDSSLRTSIVEARARALAARRAV